MRKKLFNLILMLVGGLGAVVLSILAIAERNAPDVASVIPITTVCCTVFLAGYVAYLKEK